MRLGFCVIGLERDKACFRSLRPIPPNATAWRAFSYQRGDKVAFDLSPARVVQPHIEDRIAGRDRRLGSVSEHELVNCLRQAENAVSVKDLFGCHVHLNPGGGQGMYVNPDDATRSICGCQIKSISFSLRINPLNIRADLALESGETLVSLPVVDYVWHQFATLLTNPFVNRPGAHRKLEDYLNSFVRSQVVSSSNRFARIGISRAFKGGCWLMLDSLFPLPKTQWVQQFI